MFIDIKPYKYWFRNFPLHKWPRSGLALSRTFWISQLCTRCCHALSRSAVRHLSLSGVTVSKWTLTVQSKLIHWQHKQSNHIWHGLNNTCCNKSGRKFCNHTCFRRNRWSCIQEERLGIFHNLYIQYRIYIFRTGFIHPAQDLYIPHRVYISRTGFINPARDLYILHGIYHLWSQNIVMCYPRTCYPVN